jgi:hypothetical protein
MSTITLDQIVKAVTDAYPDATPAVQGAGIAAAIKSIDASTIAPKRERKAKPAAKPATIAHKAKGNEDWKSGKPSVKQLDRMNRLETALNRHYGEDCALSVAKDFANAGDLSDQYRALAVEGKNLGLNWAA